MSIKNSLSRMLCRELEGNSVAAGEAQRETDAANEREDALRTEYEDRLDMAREAQMRALESAHQDLLFDRALLAKEAKEGAEGREREREEGEARRSELEATIQRLEAERRVEQAEAGGTIRDARAALRLANKQVSFPLRVVHLGRSTCHAISGRGD